MTKAATKVAARCENNAGHFAWIVEDGKRLNAAY